MNETLVFEGNCILHPLLRAALAMDTLLSRIANHYPGMLASPRWATPTWHLQGMKDTPNHEIISVRERPVAAPLPHDLHNAP